MLCLQQTPLDKRVKLAAKLRKAASTEVLGGAAVIGTAVVAGAALGIVAVGMDLSDLLSNVPDMASCACDGCDGCLDMFTGCFPC